jgi:signal transduction histidine kinase
MREELVKLGRDVHALSRRLHPSILDDLGLVEAVRSEADRLARAGSVAVDFRLDGALERVPGDVGLCLFRAAQEALRNVDHHAHAARVLVALAPASGGVELTVSDDGVGFDPGVPRRCAGLGQVSMRERLNLVGGRLSIESQVGRGTTVRAWAPLAGGAA